VIAKEILNSLKSRSTDAKLLLILNEGVGDFRLESSGEKASLFTETVLHFGVSSLSHLLTTVERVIGVFRELSRTAEQKLGIIEAVMSFWKARPQYKVLVVDKLLALRILDGVSVINFIFTELVIPEASSGYVWELLRRTVAKTISRTETVEAALEEDERVLRQMKEKGADGESLMTI